jgi:VIT family
MTTTTGGGQHALDQTKLRGVLGTTVDERTPAEPRDRVLDPIARVSEILFGVIMALTFTGTFSAATAGREELRSMLIGVIGCNLAWGLVDAVMFLMSSLSERGNGIQTLLSVQRAQTPDAAHRVIVGVLPPLVASVFNRDDLERVRAGLLGIAEVPAKPSLTKADWTGALAVFLLVFLSTFPIVIPFLLIGNLHLALRVSNGIALAMLFITGWVLARHGGHNPWWTGLAMTLVGVVLVGVTIALGG